jgi:hypothetical protein
VHAARRAGSETTHCRQALFGEDGDQRTDLALETAQNRLSYLVALASRSTDHVRLAGRGDQGQISWPVARSRVLRGLEVISSPCEGIKVKVRG